MSEKHYCDLCGEYCGDEPADRQTLFKAGYLGRPERVETCFKCTVKISKLVKAAGMFGGMKT